MTARDPIGAVLDEVLGREPGTDLKTATRHLPTDAEAWFVRRAIAAAHRRRALPSRIHLRWVWAPGKSRGEASRRGEIYSLVINLAECRSGHEMAEVALHECQHLSDMASGAWSRLTRAELERRAIAFAAEVPVSW